MATHSNTLAWKTPRTEEPGRLQSMGSQRARHDWATSLSFFLFSHLNYIIGLLKCLPWLPVLSLQNPLQCTLTIKDLLQLQCSPCLYVLLFPFLLLRSLIWLFKFNLALRSRFQLLVQGLNLSDLFNLLLSLPFLGSYNCIYPVLLCAVICRRTKQFNYNLWKYPVFFSCIKK